MIKNQLILVVNNKKKYKFYYRIYCLFFFLAQGPLMITGPGINVYQQGGFGGVGMYPSYGGGAPGYSGY